MQRSSPPFLPVSLRRGTSISKKTSRRDFSVVVKPSILMLLIAIMFVMMQSVTGLRFIIAISLFLTLSTLIWNFPSAGILATFAFLALLGGVRRWLIPDFGWPSYDPLVIVGALIPIFSFLPLLISRKIPVDTVLSKYVKFLALVMAIQFFNPLQGGFLVGFGGVLFYAAPLLWFYVGRTYGNRSILMSLFLFSVILFAFTGCYGIKQVVIGLSDSEQKWVEVGGYGAMSVSSNAIRIFSTFASTQEYSVTLACAISVCASMVINRKYYFAFLFPLLVVALLLTATRGPIVFALLSICLQWAFFGRNRSAIAPRLCFALFIGVIGMTWSLSSIDTTGLAVGQSDILEHQKAGLLDPANSTASGHSVLVFNGILAGFTKPLGSGLGSTTIAAGKLGSGIIESGSETDLGNMFISLGIVGGVVYCIVIFWVFKQSVLLWQKSRNIVFLALIGLLVVCFGQWLSGGLYSICFLIWFSIGVMDREFAAKLAAEAPSVPTEKRGFRFAKRPAARRLSGQRPALQPKALGYKPSNHR